MNARSIWLRGPPSRRVERRARAPDPATSWRPRSGEGGGGDADLLRSPGPLQGAARAPPPEATAHAPPSPAPPRSAAHARALQPAAGSAREPRLPRAPAAPRAGAHWGALPSHPARPRAGPSPPPASLLPPPGCARLLPEGRRGLRGRKQDGGRRRQAREPAAAAVGSGTGARARSRLPLPPSTPGQSPTLLPRAARLAAPNNNGARGQVAARGQRRHWPGGERGAPGLAGGRGLGRAGAGLWREAGREAAGAGPGRGPRLCAQRALSVRSGCINNSERQRRRQRRVRAGGGGSSGDRAAAAMHPSEAGQPRHP